MRFNPEKHHRRSIRLQGYDYSLPAYYFVTICTYDKECLFGEVLNGEMKLNELGRIVEFTWRDLPHHVAQIETDEYMVMPNHFHGIIHIVGAGSKPAPSSETRLIDRQPGSKPEFPSTTGLPEIVRQFKTFSAKRINEIRQTPETPVWQRNYFERIVRNESELIQIQKYVQANPANWLLDEENPLK